MLRDFSSGGFFIDDENAKPRLNVALFFRYHVLNLNRIENESFAMFRTAKEGNEKINENGENKDNDRYTLKGSNKVK